MQALLPGPAVKLLGERGAVFTGIAGACVALSGIGAPALQSLATRVVDEDRQGQFQGVWASVTRLASIVAPMLFATIYFLARKKWPGAIWLCALAVNALAIPLVLSLRFRLRS